MKVPGIGERINQRRIELGWKNLMEFALDLHRSPQVVHAWVTRGQTPQWEALTLLADKLQCPVVWLLMGDEAFGAVPGLLAFYESRHGKPLAVPGWSRTGDLPAT